jgi:uncharacterized membrane protein
MDLSGNQNPTQASEAKETERLSAFSDGVFAVAITLLVFDFKLPNAEQLSSTGQTLIAALLDQWVVYLAYITSFLTILVMWVNHHNLLRQIQRIDRMFLLINGLLLMLIAAMPFPTALVVAYIQQPAEQTLAAAIYSGVNLILAILFAVWWFYASYDRRLLAKNFNPQVVATIDKRFRVGPIFYVVTLGVAFVNAWVSVALCLLLAFFFALPSGLAFNNIRLARLSSIFHLPETTRQKSSSEFSE